MWAEMTGDAALPAEALLQIWDSGGPASPGERGLLLLGLAAPGLSAAARGALSVGQRDRLLMDLFVRLFGGAACSLATCPGCGEELEFDVTLADIHMTERANAPQTHTLAWHSMTIAYRLPCAGDLAALGTQQQTTIEEAACALARRCVLSIDGADAPSARALPQEALDALQSSIAARVTEADPQAVVTLDVQCPCCAAPWQALFDIVDFLWRRLDSFLDGMLRDTHLLASRYGWSERDIIALPPSRRRRYLALIGA